MNFPHGHSETASYINVIYSTKTSNFSKKNYAKVDFLLMDTSDWLHNFHMLNYSTAHLYPFVHWILLVYLWFW